MPDIAVTQQEITSAYIHIPFCTHKCEFCDFAAVAGMSHLEDEYTNILCGEIDQRLKRVSSPIRLSTVFFGGGTPGLIATANLARIFETLASRVIIEDSIEFSIETTPHAITAQKAREWKKLGINRISIGVESLQDSELKAIGRDHTRSQALQGLALAASEFENINVDFMYGLPTQTIDSWRNTLEELVGLTAEFPSIKHVSSYCLELAINSPLLSRFPRSSDAYPQDEGLAQFFEVLLEVLTGAGFLHYEVSNFARPGYLCRHNLACWRNLQYLAFGVGAHRYVDGYRSANFKSLARYMREYMSDETSEFIDGPTRIKEGLMLGLRMRQGIDVDEFEKQYGINLAKAFSKQIDKLQSGGFVEWDGRRLRISDAGVLISNSVLAEFM